MSRNKFAIPIAHVSPMYPVPVQLQLKAFTISKQIPPFSHGSDAHSLISKVETES